MSLKKLSAAIRKNKSFLLTTHTNPEGDALGSELAFARLLRKMGKHVAIVNEDNLPYGYDILPGTGSIVKYKDNLKDIKFDCFCILDCSDLKRCGEVYKINSAGKPILNIDHHISNGKFAAVNWVEPKSSSTSEMVYRLYKELDVPLDRDAALLLYVGILTDTGSFRYSNTTYLTHKIASELLKFKLDVNEIYNSLYGQVPFEDMQLLARVLPTMRRTAGGKVAWFQMPHDMLRGRKVLFDLSESVLTFGRSIKGVEAVMFFKENLGVKNEIRVNFRSQGRVDVNKIAACFGGGGHKTASGATIHGPIDKVRKAVLSKICKSL